MLGNHLQGRPVGECPDCHYLTGHSPICPTRAIIGKGTLKTPYEGIQGSIQGGQGECGVPEGVIEKRRLELERERDEARAKVKQLHSEIETLQALVRHYHQLLLIRG